MESKEYKLLESLIAYHKKKNELEILHTTTQLNDRMNKITEQVNELTEKVDRLLDELKPITTIEHGNWESDL